MAAILGLNAYHGDAAAALVIDGELVAAAEEERFNRVKHCAGFPALAARWCLEDAGLSAADLDHVAVSRDPRANLGRKLMRTIRHGASARYLKQRLQNGAQIRDVGSALSEALGVERIAAAVHNVEHHQAHVASAFFVSPFEDAAILSVDGFGDFASTMLAEGHGSRFTVLDRVLFPHSLGIFYTAVTQWLGFPKYGDEGKVMGLAPLGRPRYLDKMHTLVRLQRDGTFELNLDYFVHHAEGATMTWSEGEPKLGTIFSDQFTKLFGEPRVPRSEITEYQQDVAASMQAMLEEAELALVRKLQRDTGQKALCMAGGVALNSAFNGKILPCTDFEDIYIQPAAGDAGTSLGVCFYIYHQILGQPRTFVMNDAYTGPRYSDDETRGALERAGLKYTY